MNNDIKYIEHSYKTIASLLKEKADITYGEVTNLKALINYIISQDSGKKEDNTQFFKDVKNLYSALEELKSKIDIYLDDLSIIKRDRIGKIDEHNNHLSLIPLLDCMQERSYSIAEKLEYLNQSYENLIEPYTSLYLPMPIVSKRIKTSNLMLYFNDSLNTNYENLRDDFFEIKDKEKKVEGVFSTWDFSTTDHVKSISDKEKVFISLSFWFFEKQIFYPIAFHEIAHSLYYRLKEDKLNNEKDEILLTGDEKDNIKRLLFGNSAEGKRLIIDSAFISSIYQDIIADFSAFSLSGVSYIFTLFYSTFFFNIHQNFYIDLAITKIDKKITNNDKRCINQEENTTLLDWGTSNKTSNKHLNSMYIRLSLLLKLAKESEDSNIDKFEKELKGIELILNLIYPKSKLNISTFEDILTNFAKQNKQYQINKNYTFLLLEEFERIIFTNKKLHIKVKKLVNKIEMFDKKKIEACNNDENSAKVKFRKKIKDFISNKYSEEDFNEIKKTIDSGNIKSQYDLYWYLKLKGCNHIGRMLRLHNLLELHIEPDVELKDAIYELIYFKYHYKKDEKNPLLDFDENRIGNIENHLKKKEDLLGYALGPYDIALLTNQTTANIDLGLKKYIDKKSFFTDRHALFLLKEFLGTSNESIFDIVFSIDIKGELKPKNTYSFYDNFNTETSLVDYLSSSCQKSQLFASMGNENFILYIHKLDITKLKKLIYKLLQIEKVSKMSTTILINDMNKNTEIDRKFIEFEMLCKVRNSDENYKANIDKITHKLSSYKNIDCSLKFGVYDISIKTKDNKINIDTLINIAKEIDEYVEDIQIEPCISVDLGCKRV